jgi:L-asparaginase / beta-aspartyl-peptidase
MRFTRKGLKMRRFLIISTLLLIFLLSCEREIQKTATPVLVVHGGAGVIIRSEMSGDKERIYKQKLAEVLLQGYALLQSGSSSLDAVESATMMMEDSPLFNAGKGAVFAANGKNELDAAIMDGKTGQAGAVTCVRHIKNPIQLARLVMEKSPHVLLAGEGAEEFGLSQGLALVAEEYFFSEQRWQQYLRAKEEEQRKNYSPQGNPQGKSMGTVGAVALDRYGNLAAGTSTGGRTFKMSGRVGDTPLIGAGTYASNHTCAVSATGHGEFFMRGVVAYDIVAMMEYKGLSVAEAVHKVIDIKLSAAGGTGGVIALDARGNMAISFNTEGMYRGYINEDKKPVIYIYKE